MKGFEQGVISVSVAFRKIALVILSILFILRTGNEEEASGEEAEGGEKTGTRRGTDVRHFDDRHG